LKIKDGASARREYEILQGLNPEMAGKLSDDIKYLDRKKPLLIPQKK
jgi:hypothetical protein